MSFEDLQSKIDAFSPDQHEANALVQGGTSSALKWAVEIEKDSWYTRDSQWWHMLAEWAAFEATQHTDLAWSRFAVFIYDRLAQDEPPYRAGFGLSAMYLRALMISRLGAKSGDDVLDLDRIPKWFYAHTALSVEEALTKSSQPLQDMDFDDLRELRAIKNRLGVIKLLVSDGSLHPDETLTYWLEIRQQLP